MVEEILVANGAHVETLRVAIKLLALHTQGFGHAHYIIILAIIIKQPFMHVSITSQHTTYRCENIEEKSNSLARV